MVLLRNQRFISQKVRSTLNLVLPTSLLNFFSQRVNVFFYLLPFLGHDFLVFYFLEALHF